MRSIRFSVISGAFLVALGTVVLWGWLRHDPALVRLIPGADAMSWSSALGWLCVGTALILKARQRTRGTSPFMARVPGLLGLALILLAFAALTEWLSGYSLGISLDPAATARWLDDGYPFPGRMRPLSAVGFLATGFCLWLLPQRNVARWALRLAVLLSLVVVGVGILGIAGSFSPVASLYVGPVTTTGIGFVVCGFGLLALQASRPDYEQVWGGDDSQRITLLAGMIVVVTGMVGIIGGFGVLYPQVIKELEENLTLALQSGSDELEDAIREGWQVSNQYANQPLRLDVIERLSRRRGLPGDRQLMQRVVDQAAGFDFSGARFLDLSGRVVAESGTFVRHPDLSVPLRLPAPATLLWSDGYVFHSTVPMLRHGAVVGFLESERRLRSPDAFVSDKIGATVDFPVCAPVPAGLDCFPFRSTGGKVLHDLPDTYQGRLVPLAYAALGRHGIARTTDYRGVEVIAAYAPVGDLGLVAGYKIDAAEFYEPVARRVWPLLLLLLAVGAGSILLLHLQVLPLVRKMRREINERRKAEERLQQSEANLAEITATLGEGVYVLDAHGAITFVNPEAERLLGWSAAELRGRDAHRLFHWRRPDGTLIAEKDCPVHQSFVLGATYRSTDEWFVRKDGSFVPVAITSSPIVRQGRIEGSVASFVDVSEQKRVARELARHRDHLEQLVEERTGELRKLNHELEAFSYSVSHDLRAPLRAINGYSGALREDYGDALPPDAHDYLNRMQAATIRMGELVDGLLNLSQVIRSEPDLTQVDLSRMAETIAASLREAEPRRRVTFRIAPDVVVIGDHALLRVLLENLFVNAWKFTAGRPEGVIEFGCDPVSSACYVRDNGVGFDMQFAHKLFQPFERLLQHGQFAGNGIGLATVRRIVERHGGRVWAESGLDQGTTIHFSLGRQPVNELWQAWGSERFAPLLKQALEGLPAGTIPLGRTGPSGGVIDDSRVLVTILDSAVADEGIQAEVGVLFNETVGVCPCSGDEPETVPAYTQITVRVDRAGGLKFLAA